MPEPRIRIRSDLVSVERSARMAGLARNTITKKILDGEIGAERIGSWYFCHRADVERLARERLNVPAVNA